MTDTNFTLAEAIRSARIRAGKNQQQVADETGISKSHISLIENGHREPSIATLERIAASVRVPVGALALFLPSTSSGAASLDAVLAKAKALAQSVLQSRSQ